MFRESETDAFAKKVSECIIKWVPTDKLSNLANGLEDMNSFASHVELVAETVVLGVCPGNCPKAAMEDDPDILERIIWKAVPTGVDLARVPTLVASYLRGN